MADPAKAESATGYVLGGISPLGQRRPLPTTLDESALEHETIHVSGGRRGPELELDPSDPLRPPRASGRAVARAGVAAVAKWGLPSLGGYAADTARPAQKP